MRDGTGQPHSTSGRAEYSFLQKVMIVGGTVALFLFVREVGELLALLFAGVLLGVSLHALGAALAKRTGWSVDAALTVCLVVIFLAVAASLWFFGQEIASQFDSFFKAARQATRQVADRLGEHELGRRAIEWSSDAKWVSGSAVLARITGVVSLGAGATLALGIVLSVALFLAYRPEAYRDGALALVPRSRRKRAAEVLDAMACVLSRWVAGRVLDMIVVGAVTAAGLWLLGSPAPLALGLFTGLVLFIPFFGPIIATIPAVLVSLPDGMWPAASVVALYVGIQIVEGFVFLPLIEQAAVKMPAALVIGNQVLFGALLGLVGVLVATPLLATAAVAVKMLYIEDALGDDASLGECRPQGTERVKT